MHAVSRATRSPPDPDRVEPPARPRPCPAPHSAERRAMIAVAAYYLAERRAFAPGEAERDWCLAERQIERMLAERDSQDNTPFNAECPRLRHALRLWAECQVSQNR